MNILCSICRDVFTGAENEAIYTTSCGHVFHHQCILQWMERVQSCPHCRRKITDKNIFRLNLYFEGEAGPRTGLEDYKQRNLSFELSMNKIQLENLRESSRTALEQSKGLRLQVKKLEEELKVVKSRECTVLQQNRNLKAELASERQKKQCFGNPSDVIDLELDDSDPELYQDIHENLRTMRRNASNQDPNEVIVLDDSIRANDNENNRTEIQKLREEIQLQKVQLASADARIRQLEDENFSWKLHGAENDSDIQIL